MGGWSQGRDSSRAPGKCPPLIHRVLWALRGLRRRARALSAVRLRRPTARSKSGELGSIFSGPEGSHNEHFYF